MLRLSPFCADLSDSQIEELVQYGQIQTSVARQTLFNEGEPGACLYVVISGKVKIYRKGEPSGEIELAVLGSGECFGEMALLDDSPRSASAITLEPCVFFVLDRAEFASIMSRFPALIRAQIASLTAKVREINQRFVTEVVEKQNLRLQMERERFQSLFQLTAAANDAKTVDDALQVVLDQVCEYTGWSVGLAFMADEKAPEVLKLTGACHMSDPEAYESLRCESDLATRVRVAARPLLVGDLTRQKGSLRLALAASLGLRAAFAFPVKIEKEVVAVLEFFAYKPSLPEDLLVRAMTSLGRQLGAVIEKRRWEEHLLRTAFHDALTGLANRPLFLDRLRESLKHSKRDPQHLFAVLFIDMDQFKRVNDTLGHAAGDQYLIEIAHRLQGSVRDVDTVARFGGDEFVVLLDDVRSFNSVPRTVERIRTNVSVCYSLEGSDLFPSASIGIALSAESYERAEDLLRDADIAMYRAKTNGRGSHQIFNQSMHEETLVALQLESALQQAMDRHELHLHYQPIVSLATGSLTGFESLMRWRPTDPDRKPVGPAIFIPIAEQAGLIVGYTDWSLQTTCRQLRKWQTEYHGQSKLRVSVNLCAKYLVLPNVVERVLTVIEENGLDPSTVALEITEGQMVEDMESCSKSLGQLSDAGCRIYVDDFGTGYSSLSYLARLRVNALKIDRSFVMHMDRDDRSSMIVRMIVSLGQNLGLDVIAEGVETAGQRDFLRQLKCQYGQGYLFDRALDPEAAGKLLARSSPTLSGGGDIGVERLRAFELFETLPDDEMARIAKHCGEMSVQALTVLIRQGQVGQEVFFLEAGTVGAYRGGGSPPDFLAILHAPAIFGERALMDPERIRTANVQALTDLRVLTIRIGTLLEIFKRHPSLGAKMRQMISGRVKEQSADLL